MNEDPARPLTQRVTGALAAAAACTVAATITVVELADMGLGRPVTWTAAAVAGLAVVALIHVGLLAPLRDVAAAERRRRLAAERAAEERRRLLTVADELDDRLARAGGEAAVLDALRLGVLGLLPDGDHALWLCDADGALSSMLPMDARGFGHPSPTGQQPGRHCPAVEGAAVLSDGGGSGHPCGHDDELAVSSVCVPVHHGGTKVGVVRSVAAAGDLPTAAVVDRLERMARRAAERIDHLRHGQHSAPAPTRARVVPRPTPDQDDPADIVGTARSLLATGQPFAVALCAVDERPPADDLRGATPEEAAALVGEVLHETLRPDDVIARVHDDAFMIMFAGAGVGAAVAAMERVREHLVLRLADRGLDPFTVSSGVAEAGRATDLEDLMESAELALMIADRLGGNRVRAWLDGTDRDLDHPTAAEPGEL